MFKILTLLTLAASPLAAFHVDTNLLFLHDYACEKREIALETISQVYSEDVELFLLGKSEAYTDMLYVMSFMISSEGCD